jgi:hypothetical protein
MQEFASKDPLELAVKEFPDWLEMQNVANASSGTRLNIITTTNLLEIYGALSH